jgi:hypothetical protein
MTYNDTRFRVRFSATKKEYYLIKSLGELKKLEHLKHVK